MSDTTPHFDMVTPENACALLVDHQPGLYFAAGDIRLGALLNNSIALAKVLRLNKIPTVLTCAAQGPAGPLGPLLPEIAEQFPGIKPVYRTKINSWHDPEIRAAIEATGRKKVICAGLTGDFCAGLPAKSMAAEGYDVRLVMDASSNDSSIVLQCAIADLVQHGVKVHGWVAIACELMGDWARKDAAEGLVRIYGRHLPTWPLLQAIQKGHSERVGA